MSGEAALMRLVTDARVPEPFRPVSGVSSGSPMREFGQVVVMGRPKFLADARTTVQPYRVFVGNQPAAQKEQGASEIRFLADAKAQELAALGEEEFRRGNTQRGVELSSKMREKSCFWLFLL